MVPDDALLNDRHFVRRMSAARAGMHLPSEEELLRGMAFFRGELAEDVREYASRMSRRLKKRNCAALLPVAECLDELAVDPDAEGIASLQQAVDAVGDEKGFPVAACRLRCRIYRAWLGDSEAMALVAAEIASLAFSDARGNGPSYLMWRSLSWGSVSTWRRTWKQSGVAVVASRHHTETELHRAEQQFRRAFRNEVEREVDERLPKAEEPKDDELHSDHDLGIDIPYDEADAASRERPPDGIVILREIGNDTTAEGKRVRKEFEAFIGRPQPLARVPDLVPVRKGLVHEFPYAERVIDTVLKGFAGRDHVWMRPTVLLGSPGSGKTRFARRLAEALETPYELVSCGGLSDSAVGGTARRWASGEPSLPVMAIRRHKCANPVVILDEIEKVGTSRHNGSVHDVLVGLFEDETARRWHDPYVESRCNLRFVTWLMTANAVEPIPAVLRDRCRIIRFPEPRADDVAVLAPRILEHLYVETGHDPRWATPLEGYELASLRQAWGGGSVRKLQRLVEGLIEARERERSRQ